MNKLILITYLFIPFAISAQPASDKSETFITTIKGHYLLEHPESWRIDTSKILGTDMFIRSPRTDSLDDFNENVNVFVQDLSGQGYNLLKMATESEAQIKNMITDVVIIESKLDSSGSEPYYKLYFTGSQGKFSLTIMQQYYLKNEIGYALTMTLKNGNEKERYMLIGKKVLKSFKIQ